MPGTSKNTLIVNFIRLYRGTALSTGDLAIVNNTSTTTKG